MSCRCGQIKYDGPASHIPTLGKEDARFALRKLFGADPAGSLAEMHSQLQDALLEDDTTQTVQAAPSWDLAIDAAVKARCLALLKSTDVVDPEQTASKFLGRCSTVESYEAMWQQLVSNYFPVVPEAPARHTKAVLVIGPGFGMKSNPALIGIIRNAGFAKIIDVHPPVAFTKAGLAIVVEAIKTEQPDAILCASKGGAYMTKLWNRMRLPKIANDYVP